MIPRQERIGDWRRAETLYQQLKSLRGNGLQWLVAEPGPQARECRHLTDELLRLGEKYGVGHPLVAFINEVGSVPKGDCFNSRS